MRLLTNICYNEKYYDVWRYNDGTHKTYLSECTNDMDVHFAIDGSEQMGETMFEQVIMYVKNIGHKFIVSEHGSHISVSVFGNNAKLSFNFEQGSTQEDFQSAMNGVAYIGETSSV